MIALFADVLIRFGRAVRCAALGRLGYAGAISPVAPLREPAVAPVPLFIRYPI